jgi:hypothetical protein
MQYSADSRVPRGGKRLVSLARVDYEFVTFRAYYYFLNRRVALYKFYIHTHLSFSVYKYKDNRSLLLFPPKMRST